MQRLRIRRRLTSEVTRFIRPRLPPARQHQDYRALRNRTVPALPFLEILSGQPIIPIFANRRPNVDDHSRSNQLLQRNFIDCLPPLCEMNWRINVGASMLGHRKLRGRIPVTLYGLAPRGLFPDKWLVGRPEDRP